MRKLKKKKAFTLIELLAVIVILAVILVIAFPQIMNKVTSTKVASYNAQLELIKKAADVYRVQYIEEIEDSNNIEVTIAVLKEKELLPESIINPITKEEFADDMIVKITTVAGVESFELVEAEKGPELVTGMIPVYYDEVNMVWRKADKTTNDWYDYDAFKWANAVTVTSATRATHNSAAVGTTIPMTDINTMFVWIPRYKYRIPAGTGPREIDVVFETKDTAKSNGDAVTTYYTHPAFTFGSEELNGIWVGKFETSGAFYNSTLKIVPEGRPTDQYSIKSIYDGIKTKIQGNAQYGFTNEADAHMMKNTEWGAVVYLYHSKYGKYGNTVYTGINKEIFMNNSCYGGSCYKTGGSMGRPGGTGVLLSNARQYDSNGNYSYDGKCSQIYTGITECETGIVGQLITNKTLSYGASTTGTIYGIYDISGLFDEAVMGLYMPEPMPATGISDQSGFSSSTTNSQYDLLTIDSKYYDRYLTNVLSNSSIKGDALSETFGWYGDRNWSCSSGWYIWLYRGGYADLGTETGAFKYSCNNGGGSNFGFRVVIAPQI